jgi:hypothetical protein
MRRTCDVPAVAIALVVAVLSLRAQEPSDAWKQQHKVGDRHEGFGFSRDVGEAALTLVGFFVTPRDPFDPSKEPRLVVNFFSWKAVPYNVIAREISPLQNYWMDGPDPAETAKIGANEWSKWPTDVLRKADPPLEPGNVGVVIRLDASKAGGDVAPTILRRVDSLLPEHVSGYQAHFLPDAPLTDVSFKVLEGCDPNTDQKQIDGGGYGNQYKGVQMSISFSPSRPGLTTLRIDYKVKGSQAPSLRYCFWHVSDLHNPGPAPTSAR